MGVLSVVGGTGPMGFGLAVRFAAAGESVVIGSREAPRAAAAAARVRAAVSDADIEGCENLAAIDRAERIVLALPFDGLVQFLDGAHSRLAGKLLIDVVAPIVFRAGFAALEPVPGAASAGEFVQQRVPGARVVSAFKNLPAEWLADRSAHRAADVVLCGDDAAARAEVAALIAHVPGLRAVDVGPLANSRYLEAITALLLNVNRRHRTLTSITIVGLP